MTGTGFVIGSSDREVFILTAKHVVEEAHEIRVQFYDISYEDDIPASRRRAGPDPTPDSDFAVVAVEKSARKGAPLPAFKTLNVGRSPLTPGRKLATVGHPVSREWQCEPGVIKGLRYRQSDRMFLSTTIHKGGISGAPVFDENGILLGMATESAPEGGGVALDINYLLRFMSDEWRIPINFLQEATSLVIVPKPSPSGPEKGNENPQPGQPLSGPYTPLQIVPKGKIIPLSGLKEIDQIKASLKDLIREGEALRDRPGSFSQKKNDFGTWKAKCDQYLDNLFEAAKILRVHPPEYRATFDSIIEFDGRGLSEADLLQQFTSRLKKALEYLEKIVIAPAGADVKVP